MARELSLFSDYHQKENRVTNYVGLCLKLINEESPSEFERFLATFLDDDVAITVGPSFRQQEREKSGIPDLCIQQQSFSVFVETKLADWHYTEQLQRHLEDLGTSGKRVLIALAAFEQDSPETEYPMLMEAAKKNGIYVVFLSYEELLEAMKKLTLTPRLLQHIRELEIFLDRSGLLSTWKNLLDVVNCVGTVQEVLKCNAYICCNRGGAYAHRRARYMGIYTGNKKVTMIGEVVGKVSCGPRFTEPKVDWDNTGELDLIEQAKAVDSSLHDWHRKDMEVVGLQYFFFKKGSLNETDFQKDSRGGLQGSKRYFWNISKNLNVADSRALAEALYNKKWSDFS